MPYLSNRPCKLILCAGSVLCTQVVSAASVQVITDVWGGVANLAVPGCSTTGPIPDLGTFFNGGGFRALGGNVACGYTGFTADQTAATGPLLSHQSLAPVSLGAPGSSFGGSADARANYASLGVAANGLQVGDASNLTATNSTSAAFFQDTLTVNSPLVASHDNGFVRYVFKLDGSLSARPNPVAFQSGFASVGLNYSHANGPVFGVARLSAAGGSLGVFNAPDSDPSTWTFGVSSVSGSGLFGSTLTTFQGLVLNQPIQFGVPWDLKVGLLAQTIGTGDASFLSSAKIADIQFFSAAGQRINDFSLSSASGTDYLAATAPVPEPQIWAMAVCGLALMAYCRRKADRRNL